MDSGRCCRSHSQPAHQGGERFTQARWRLQRADRRGFPVLHPGQLERKWREACGSLEVADGVQVVGWAGGPLLAMAAGDDSAKGGGIRRRMPVMQELHKSEPALTPTKSPYDLALPNAYCHLITRSTGFSPVPR